MGLKTEITRWARRFRENRQIQEYEKLYGVFDKNDYTEFSVNNLPSESGFYWGEIIRWSSEITPQCVLFVGENKNTAKVLKEKIRASRVLTAGLSEVDYKWNFEEQCPVVEQDVDLVVSQAIFEHLLNPYKHLHDLANIVANNGYIMIHTVMPGFPYHRYPIDSLRFFPDWFEEAGKRFELRVVRKRIRDSHIFYMYQKIF